MLVLLSIPKAWAEDFSPIFTFRDNIVQISSTVNNNIPALVITESHLYKYIESANPDASYNSIYEIKNKEYPILIGSKSDVIGLFSFEKIPEFGGKLSIYAIIEGEKNLGNELAIFNVSGYPLISPDGKWMVALNKYSKSLEFNKLKDGNVYADYQFDDMNNASYAFSENGEYFLINLPSQEAEEGSLTMFTKAGKIAFEVDNSQEIGGVSISNDGSFSAICTEKNLSVFNREGSEMYSLKLKPGGNACAVDNDGSLVLSRREDNSVKYIDDTGKVVWEHQLEGLEGFNSTFTSHIIQDEYIYVSAQRSWKTSNDSCYLYEFNKDGKLIAQEEIAEPTIKLVQRNNHIFILAGKKLIRK